MDVIYLLKDVKNLNEYITITQDVLVKLKNGKNIKVTNNIATALTLKKIRSLEIEYLIKCDENGAACIVFEQLLNSRPSKVWGVLAKGLISSLHFWLEAVRKHLINQSACWWRFLKLILKFITEICTKNPVIPNMLVEITSECLFELATTAEVDDFQRHTILHCFNGVCDKSGREVRFAMRTKFGDYFVKIAAHMAKSGYFHYQYSLLECLVRWLVPRHEPALRAAAAEKWLLRVLCPPAATALFINRSWKTFFQDARDFLNAVNEGNGLGTSVVCRQLSIGDVVIINETEGRPSWLDFNTAGKSVSVLVDARALQAFGVPNHSGYQSLLIDNEITEAALLRRGSLGLTITLTAVRAPYIRPCGVDTGDARQVTAVISSRADLNTVDGAMRNTFGDKYQCHLDLNTVISQSPQISYKNEKGSEEDTRFSNPSEVTRRRKCGYGDRTRKPVVLASPTSFSTSSLLHNDNLVDLLIQKALEADNKKSQDKSEVINNTPNKIKETTRKVANNNCTAILSSKLYSPKVNDIDDEIQQFTDDKSDDVPLSEIKTRNGNKSSKTTATCYKELEKERKKYNIRPPKIKKSKTSVMAIPSPYTLKNNTMFDNLKHKVENTECIKLVDNDLSVYDFISDSEDKEFKKKINLKKKIYESTSSSKSTTKQKIPRRVKGTENSNEETKKIIKRKKVAKRTKQKADGKNAVSLVQVSEVLDDERLREVVREELDTSILIHHPINLEPKETEPVITEVTQIEVIYDSNSNDTLSHKSKKAKKTQMAIHVEQSNDTTKPKKRANKRAKKTELLSIKKEKGFVLKYKTTTSSDKEDEGTMSPLPGLVVETMNKDREGIDDSLTTNMLQTFKRIYKDGPGPDNDTSTTQNMLSDVDRFNFTGQDCVNITEEVCLEDVSKENMNAKATANKNKKGKKIHQLKTLKTRSQKKIKTKEYDIIEIEDSVGNDNHVDKSISTDGITAHGNSDEYPPESINEDFQPREIQDLDQSMKDYFNKLTKELHNSKDDESIISGEGEEVRNISSNISPVVSVKRLVFENISKYMPSRRTSSSDNPTSRPIISPIVSVKRLSVEDINKWMPSFNTDSQSSPIIKSTISEKITPSKLSEHKCKSIPKPVAAKTINSPETCKSPSISKARISLKEFNKWLPIPCFESQKEKGTDNNSRRMASKSPLRVLKRKSSSPIRTDAKLRRIDDPKRKVDIVSDILVNTSGQSVSSVSSEFGRAGPSGYTENLDLISLEDTLQNIMERLDTTLVEINYNTSKKFANLFVESQKQYSDQKKELAEDMQIIRDMLRNIKEKIADLDKKSQTIWNNLFESMEQQAIKLMREDTKKKRAMMQFLKDEVQAAIDHIERNRGT